MRTNISSTHHIDFTFMFTDLGDVHDLDGRQLSRLDMSTLDEKKREEERNMRKPAIFFSHGHLANCVSIVQIRMEQLQDNYDTMRQLQWHFFFS